MDLKDIKVDNKKTMFLTIGIVGLIVGIVGVTYAWFAPNVENPIGSSINITTTNLGVINFVDGPEIELEDMYPGTTEEKTFTITRTEADTTSEIEYKLILNVTNNTLTDVADGEFTYSLTGSKTGSGMLINVVDEIVPTSTITVGIGSFIGNGVHTYSFTITLDETGSDQNSTRGMGFTGYLQVEADDEYKEEILNGAYPRLAEGMIPVTIADDGVVTTIDPNSSNWYSYTNQKWANVVLVKSSGTQTRTYYETNYNATVNEADILAYLVWIPRYRYTLWNVSGLTATYSGDTCTSNCPRSIEITFENATTTKSISVTNGGERTHPAFTYDGKELNGIWVGKFETTQGTAANVGTTNPTIKPNITPWVSQNVSTQFTTSLKLSSNTAYGLAGESRMSKNCDWGATVYLSHSIYGINTEIRINNYIDIQTTKTGCADATTICSIAYGSGVSSYPQSTTGNISGIFDMSGGVAEYQMGSYTNATNDKYSGLCNISNSGFKGLYGTPGSLNCDSSILSNTTGLDYPNSKYYKLYTSTNWQSNTSYLGEALGETRNWNSDSASFVNTSSSWFLRGGGHAGGVALPGTGEFEFGSYTGKAVLYSFRVVVLTY